MKDTYLVYMNDEVIEIFSVKSKAVDYVKRWRDESFFELITVVRCAGGTAPSWPVVRTAEEFLNEV